VAGSSTQRIKLEKSNWSKNQVRKI
jgi:hypothetical protein